jgi:NAD-dependent deacetylase
MIEENLQAVAASLEKAKSVVVFTGAGVSAESGIPTYRSGDDALWSNADFERYANPRGYRKHSNDAWKWYAMRAGIARDANPNRGHDAIAEIERRVPEFTLITQNIDGLHQRAGSQNVLEIHGTIARVRCFECGVKFDWPEPLGEPVCPECHGLLRPDVVMFEEYLDHRVLTKAEAAASGCDLFISVGTSNLVAPASLMPQLALDHGARVAIVNPDLSGQPFGHRVTGLLGRAGDLLPRLVALAFGGR